MKIYLVGGAVRDKLLGLTVKDRDWVVVGATPEELTAKGYRPVGKDFPVFLHPETQEEYALARTERKSGHGYTGFVFHTSPDVTLEDDLIRRDLTINAMAEDEQGSIIDPYNGQSDLNNRILRHVSTAFEEDPLRILRVARFAARFHAQGFSIAPETMQLMKKMVASGEANYLVPERVWQETVRALKEKSPAVYFTTLMACGALKAVMPEWHNILEENASAFSALQMATTANESERVRFSCLFPPSNSAHSCERLQAFFKTMRFPLQFTERALLVNTHLSEFIDIQTRINSEQLIALFEKTDAFRRPERFIDALSGSYYLAKTKGKELDATNKKIVAQLLKQCCSIDAKPIVAQGYQGKEIGKQLRSLRIKKVNCLINQKN